MKPVIEVRKLGKAYEITHDRRPHYGTLRDEVARAVRRPFTRGARSTKEQFWALDDVSFDVLEGEIVGIIGKNGSGKSTLLKILSRITDPTRGEAILRGRVASLLEVGTGFHLELSGRENIYLNGAILGMRRQEIARKFDEIVAFSEGETFLDTPVKFYSSGMYVRLAFAVAAHLDPDVLIVDEVLAVGDADFQKKSLGKMNAAAREGRTVLFVSHSMNSVEQLCTRAIWLHNGAIAGQSTRVGEVIGQYLAGHSPGADEAEWVPDPGHAVESRFFVPTRLALTDRSGATVTPPVLRETEIWVRIEGEIAMTDPDLTIGYAIYTEDGSPLYWSYQTDVPDADWPKLVPGKIVMMSKVPQSLLNRGSFKIELIASLHFREWLLEPGQSSPFVYLHVEGAMSGSSLWREPRPGPIAPILPWIIEQ